ncbi:putative AMP-activated kinase, glycogen-binding protein [Helianthus annuus]|uniref:AMP-activated kinase, glycogen-binding protein n=1 Tax=Helianthus annuus TaxID=4232 RepID=A0A251SVX3_HELAN|nr:SNF1-related protein kinase regulatory subunit beta-2 [Helianthus annuus]KAF5775222.1 putative AMP-activated kinase, glycogen-binding protein [Helianthus annuus]KAJ0483160.1 putative AMP-activated kinase, glycogen-binding protein [Helianthus annuus]KAJ0499296.1 putative AMP-activated kinase, glycogen-binding protein [Helianthus annuus]KAJ0665315.1 putative AMP-activated kinase, glycogen-binding protein [Helianthus annuus]KAJ0860081.1 putative AMP-activated kinase, glycogen-binding protein [
MITWSYDGKEVAVEGSWDNWKTRKPLQRSGKDFIILKVLPSGVYQYRFVVDGQWRYSPDVQWTKDEAGNTFNILDLQEYVPEDIGSISGSGPVGLQKSYGLLLNSITSPGTLYFLD